jgi:hypothetical protein
MLALVTNSAMEQQNPAALGRRLRAELRRARRATCLTQQQVADAMDWSLSKVIRIESGAVRISTTDLRALLECYGLTDQKRVTSLVEMARASKKPAWWWNYRHALDPRQVTMLGYEVCASVIRDYRGTVLPSLLQSTDYAWALMAGYSNEPTTREEMLSIRLERQQVLFERESPPELCFVLDEAVLLRRVGGDKVLRTQLERLRDLAMLPFVDIRVIPFTSGTRAQAPFTLYELPADDEENLVVVVSDIEGGPKVLTDTGEAAAYLERFLELETLATSPEETVDMIDTIISHLGRDSFHGKAGV